MIKDLQYERHAVFYKAVELEPLVSYEWYFSALYFRWYTMIKVFTVTCHSPYSFNWYSYAGPEGDQETTWYFTNIVIRDNIPMQLKKLNIKNP